MSSISLEQWCKKHHREELLQEWDEKKNSSSFFPLSLSTTEYDSADYAWWKCKNGHEWRSPVIKHTIINLGCPICNSNETFLPIGFQYGCFTIAGVIPSENDNRYLCKCKCGKKYIKSEQEFLYKKHQYCTESIRRSKKDKNLFAEADSKNQCGLKTIREEKRKAAYKRVKDSSYNLDLTGTIHESLQVMECIDDHYEELRYISDARKKDGKINYVYKLYRCHCYLCDQDKDIKSSDFSINPPTEYGPHAYDGYWSNAYCGCHRISSFQWMVTKLLKENGISYRVEISFPDLFGVGQVNHLRYDFGVYDDKGDLKCLIECQGEQHYKAVEKFGGESQLQWQQENDELKRQYANEKNIPLYEITYMQKKYDEVERFLKEKEII